MKVLIVADKLSYDSATSQCIDLVRALPSRNTPCQVCATGGDLRPILPAMGVENYLIKFNYFSFRRLIKYLREFAPDIVHAFGVRGLHPGRRIASRLGISYVVTLHGVPDISEPLSVGTGLAGVIAINQGIREALVNQQGVPRGLVRVIPCGIDIDRFAAVARARRGAGRIPVVGCVGRMEAGKGQDVLIRAASRLAARGSEALLLLVGEGPEEPALRRVARDEGIGGRVTFGAPMRDVAEVFRLLDVLVVPTIREGTGFAALEAMACGVPVIATGVGEFLSLIEDERTGLLTPPGDPDALADRIERLLADPELADRLGEAGRAFVRERYPLGRMVDGTVEFYRNVLSEGTS
ncbi:MAG: glycosyltransferase family 4 protein [Planctomycetes bacterium]|nr:glycosyltransferase family 4 protein [Planctomycetota bacterium]